MFTNHNNTIKFCAICILLTSCQFSSIVTPCQTIEENLELHKKSISEDKYRQIEDFVFQFNCKEVTKVRSVYKSKYNENTNFGILIGLPDISGVNYFEPDSCLIRSLKELQNWKLFEGVELDAVKYIETNIYYEDSTSVISGVAPGNGISFAFLAVLKDLKMCQ